MKIFKKCLLFFTIFALSHSLIYADEPLKVRIDDFSGGLNSFDLADIIGINQGPTFENVILNRKGQLSKRKGQTLFVSDLSNTPFTGAGVFIPDANTRLFMAASGVEIIYTALNSTSWSRVNTGYDLTSGKDTEFIQANNLLLILNGYNPTAAFDFTTWDPGAASDPTVSAASPPVATTGAWLRNYFFAAGDPSYPDWVYFSNNLAPRTFTADDVFRVNTGDGQKIVKLEPFKLNELVIYKEKSIFILDISGVIPLTNWELQPVAKSIGCVAPKSVINIGNDQWFLSSEPFAIRSLVRTSLDKLFIDMVSQPIQDIFNGTGEIAINRTQIDKACAVLYDNKYILAIPTGTSTTNNYIVIFDFITKSWYSIDGWYISSWVVYENNLYGVDALDGRIIRCFADNYGDIASGPIVTAASDPTVAITYEYETKNIDFDNKENFKLLDALDMEFEAVGDYTATIYINLDNRGWQNIGTINMAATTPTLPAALPIVLTSINTVRKTFQLQQYGEFKKIRIKVKQDGFNEKCNLHSLTLFAKMRAWRREN